MARFALARRTLREREKPGPRESMPMSDTERIALLVENGALHGVRLVRGRGGFALAASRSWPLTPPPASDSGEEAEGAPRQAEEAALTAALRAARADWKIDSGCSLALPASSLMFKVLILPPADAGSRDAMVRLQMEKIAPYAGEDLTVSYEVLAESPEGVQVFAVAIARPALAELEGVLAAAGVRLTRLDAALLGWWHQLQTLEPFGPGLSQGRRLVLFAQGPSWDCLLIDAGTPLLARALGQPRGPLDLAREVALSLMNAELESAPAPLDALWVVAPERPADDWMEAVAEVAGRTPEFIDRKRLDQPALGTARRDLRPESLDLVPAAWREQERQHVARRRFLAGAILALLVWLLLAGALLLAPWYMRGRGRELAAAIQAREAPYRQVADVRTRVRLIRSYMDRSQSLLEVLRELCTEMPPGLDLSSLSYRRDDGVKLLGDAAQPAMVYDFKDALDASAIFTFTRLSGPTLDAARRRHRFEIDAYFEERDE